ncbi:GGDEF domain-containing protein [Ferrimonas balearica]|uniref:GGDEF domain-containing protein n=1 Tax=Ferrimonas balearica TaxID=44012 RepID=UPI001C57101C|nr:GGDEF domain-containing protein [Ferrimonas balearica]MBW3139038.1 GGDEF domain-containing protein [Ferrimonas balearica]MBY6106100.1 GGDEF domain-containing protein [Ferrimonas balearica]
MTRELSPILWCALVVVAVVLGLPLWQAHLNHYALSLELIPVGLLLLAIGLAWRFRLSYHSYLGLLLLVAYPFQSPLSGLTPLLILSTNDIYLLLALNLLLLPKAPATGAYLAGWLGWLVGQCLLLQHLSWDWLYPMVSPRLLNTPMHYLLVVPAARFFWALSQGKQEDLIPLLLGAMAWLVSGWPMPWPGGVLLYSGIAGILMLVVFDGAYRLAFRDGLTGLPARRTLDGDLSDTGALVHIAMLDVDHFKAFNDTHGHTWGDLALRELATKLRRVKGARAYRYGGEEFTLVFRKASRSEVVAALEALRVAVEEGTMVVTQSGKDGGAQPVRASLTISAGVAQRHGQHEQIGTVLKRADMALYRAKEEGRNRIVLG